jgi:glycerate-2-kinase
VGGLLRRYRIWEALSESARRYLDAVIAGRSPETPKPGDAAFEGVTTSVIVSNRHAVDAAAAYAREHGIDEITVVPTPLAGEAAICGVRMASELIARRKRQRGTPRPTQCVLWGGETTVTLGPTPGLGGRNQELALAAARSLHDALEQATGITLLSAGTDGRDGPTDAAGAIVDGLTWRVIAEAGRDPDRDLAGHDAYPALDAAHTLIRVGHTGTNVMDIVIGLIM